MSFLLLYVDEGVKFNEELLTAGIEKFAAKQQSAHARNKSLLFDFAFNDDRTTIGINRDLESVAIDGSGIASLEAAVRIQAFYPADLHLVDENYSFDLLIKGVSSSSVLLEIIRDVENRL